MVRRGADLGRLRCAAAGGALGCERALGRCARSRSPPSWWRAWCPSRSSSMQTRARQAVRSRSPTTWRMGRPIASAFIWIPTASCTYPGARSSMRRDTSCASTDSCSSGPCRGCSSCAPCCCGYAARRAGLVARRARGVVPRRLRGVLVQRVLRRTSLPFSHRAGLRPLRGASARGVRGRASCRCGRRGTRDAPAGAGCRGPHCTREISATGTRCCAPNTGSAPGSGTAGACARGGGAVRAAAGALAYTALPMPRMIPSTRRSSSK